MNVGCKSEPAQTDPPSRAASSTFPYHWRDPHLPKKGRETHSNREGLSSSAGLGPIACESRARPLERSNATDLEADRAKM